VSQHKALGNKALQASKFSEAIKCYSAAIDLDGSNHVYYSNRSAAYLSNNEFEKALEDAKACVGLKPDWAKGYNRTGAALWKIGRMNDAVKAYEDGLAKCPGDKSLEDGLAKVKDAISNPRPAGGAAGAGGNPMANLFGPALISKIAGDPKMKEYLSDPSFMQKIALLQQNPNNLQAVMGDPRIMEVLSLALGGNVSFGAPPGGEEAAASRQAPPQEKKKEPEVSKLSFSPSSLGGSSTLLAPMPIQFMPELVSCPPKAHFLLMRVRSCFSLANSPRQSPSRKTLAG